MTCARRWTAASSSVRFNWRRSRAGDRDRKSTRLNSSHTVIYTLSLHDALPISAATVAALTLYDMCKAVDRGIVIGPIQLEEKSGGRSRSEEHTSELQSHRDLHSFPTRRSSDLRRHRCRIDAL